MTNFVEHGGPGNGPVTYHNDHLAAPCCAEVERLTALQERTQHWLDEFQGKLAEATLEILRLREGAD